MLTTGIELAGGVGAGDSYTDFGKRVTGRVIARGEQHGLLPDTGTGRADGAGAAP